ncbi:MAG TPA: hypothetical protein VHE35_09700 [Kofleriaceae bacterium]|nr:hypothetical protein [Kofleriaceae bacterium]
MSSAARAVLVVGLVGAGAAVGLGGAAGCRRHRGEDPVVSSVRAGIAAQLGMAPSRVACTRDRCEVEVGGTRLGVAVRGGRDATWQSDEVVLAAPLVDHVRAELAALGVDAAVDCGAAVQPVPADGRLTCKVGDAGAAWVRLGTDGAVDVDVALTAAEVAARTAPVDDEALERLSRALDSDEAEGSEGAEGQGDDPDDDGDDARDDAGVDAAGVRAAGG